MPTAQLHDCHVNWLVNQSESEDNTMLVLPMTFALQRQDYFFPPEVGHGWCEYFALADGISLFQGIHHFRPEASGQWIPVGEFKSEFPQATLFIQTIQGGECIHQEFHPPTRLVYKPGYDFFRHADRMHLIPLVNSSSDSKMTALIIADMMLVELMGEDIAQQLIDRLGLNTLPTVKVIPIPLHISAPLRASISLTLQGQLKVLSAQSKVLEYLCGLAVYIGTQVSTSAVYSHKREKVRELYDYIMHLEGKLPTLDELAIHYGMSVRCLNDEFTREYGLPIYSFITNHRLNEAHVALLESDLPIKVLAQRLGYSHVNHFTIAFKNKFGYPPGSLRASIRLDRKSKHL